MGDATTTVWGTIQGREITFPMEVPSMAAATLLFSVPADAAARLLPGDAFEVVEVAPGTAQLAVTMPCAAPTGPSPSVEAVSYSYLDGVSHATALRMDMGTGVVDPSTVVVELGTGTIADELRSLGLPTATDLATWGEGLTATFQAGQPP